MAGLYDLDIEATLFDDVAVKWDDPDANVELTLLTLLTPADDTSEDLTDGATFTWNHPGTQTTYAFRRRRVSSGPWEYWNGSGWQSTVTFISSATEAVTFSAGQW